MRSSRGLMLLVAAGTMLVAGAGCRRSIGQGPTPSSPVPLFVENHGYLDVAVYAMRSASGPHTRLGTVTGLSKMQVVVPYTELQSGGTLMLYLHAIGSAGSWVSPSVMVSADDAAVLEIYADASGDLSRSVLYTTILGDKIPGVR